jgi:hypothetical protein
MTSDEWVPCPVCGGGQYLVLDDELIWDGLHCNCEWLAIPLWRRAVKVARWRIRDAACWCKWHLCLRWVPGMKTRQEARLVAAVAEAELRYAAMRDSGDDGPWHD